MIDGVGYEPYTVTVDTVVLDRSTGKVIADPVDRATVQRSGSNVRTFVDGNVDGTNVERAPLVRPNVEGPVGRVSHHLTASHHWLVLKFVWDFNFLYWNK